MPKNPRSVALGKLGGLKGGPARAQALTAERRIQIARKAGRARVQKLTRAQRSELGRRAAKSRWDRSARVNTAQDAPPDVRKLLKTYDPAKLRWRVRAERYEVVVAVLTRGNEAAKRWLSSVLSRDDIRALVRQYKGAGCAEPDRARLRRRLRLSQNDIPKRPYLGLESS